MVSISLHLKAPGANLKGFRGILKRELPVGQLLVEFQKPAPSASPHCAMLFPRSKLQAYSWRTELPGTICADNSMI